MRSRPPARRSAFASLALAALAVGCGVSGGATDGYPGRTIAVSLALDGGEIIASVTGTRDASEGTPVNDWYEASLEGDAVWVTPHSGNCEILDEAKTIHRCFLPFGSDPGEGPSAESDDERFEHTLRAAPRTGGSYRVSVRYGNGESRSDTSMASVLAPIGSAAYPGAASTSASVSGPADGPEVPAAVTASVSGRREAGLAGGDWIEVNLRGQGRWDEASLPEICTPVDDTVLRCTPRWIGDGGEERFETLDLPVLLDTADVLRVEVSTCVQRGTSPDSCLPSYGWNGFDEADADYEFSTPAPIDHYLAGPDEVALSSAPRTLRFEPWTHRESIERKQWAETLTVDVVLPETVDLRVAYVTAQSCFRTSCDDKHAYDCDMGERITCRLSADHQWGGHGTPGIHLVISTENAELGADVILTLSGDERTDNNVHRVRAVGYRDAAGLQQIVDATPDGERVTFPPGRWLGTVDGRGRTLRVQGALGAAPTVLRSPLHGPALLGTGPDSHWSDIHYELAGGALIDEFDDGLTLSDSRIESAKGLGYQTLLASRLPAGFTLSNNLIAGFGTGAAACRTLIDVPQTFHGTRVRLTGNRFVGNRCGSLILYAPTWSDETNELVVVGNTFVGSPVIARLLGSPGAIRNVDFADNVVVDADSVFSIETSTGSPTERGVRTATNLVWTGDGSALPSSDARDGIVVVEPDLHADPLFVDPDAGDFRPSILSPVVDAGSSPRHVREAVDGDGDGIAEHDIGAFEFRP